MTEHRQRIEAYAAFLAASPGAIAQERAADLRAILGDLDEANSREADALVRWCVRLADIREASGVGVKPMLDEVPGAIRDRIAGIEAERDAAQAKLAKAVEVMRRVEPFLDAIVCYASSMDEHEPNRIAHEFRAFLSRQEGASQ